MLSQYDVLYFSKDKLISNDCYLVNAFIGIYRDCLHIISHVLPIINNVSIFLSKEIEDKLNKVVQVTHLIDYKARVFNLWLSGLIS